VARDPERFLIPELAGDVSLESLLALFQQAKHAGALDKNDQLQQTLASNPSAAEFFETMRGRLYKTKWGLFKPKPKALRDELRDATACVEETNRVLSLAEFLDESQQAKQQALEAICWYDQEAREGSSPYFAWGV
jgi:hypothetical protein